MCAASLCFASTAPGRHKPDRGSAGILEVGAEAIICQECADQQLAERTNMLYSAVVETFHAERRPLRRTAIRTQANAMSGSLAEFTADSIPSRKHVDAACARGADGAKACAAHT
jgi:hypothetical protein